MGFDEGVLDSAMLQSVPLFHSPSHVRTTTLKCPLKPGKSIWPTPNYAGVYFLRVRVSWIVWCSFCVIRVPPFYVSVESDDAQYCSWDVGIALWLQGPLRALVQNLQHSFRDSSGWPRLQTSATVWDVLFRTGPNTPINRRGGETCLYVSVRWVVLSMIWRRVLG